MPENETYLKTIINNLENEDLHLIDIDGQERILLMLKVYCLNLDLELYTEEEMEEVLTKNDGVDLDKVLEEMKQNLEDCLSKSNQ